MTTAEMQTQVKCIIDNEYGTSAFAVLNSNEGLLLKKFLLDDTLKAKIGEMLEGILRNNYLDEEAQVDSSDNIADNSKIFYEIIQSTEYQPFAFLDTFDSATESYSESDAEQIMGFAFRLNVNDSGIWLYQQLAHPQMIKRSRHLYAMLSKNKIYTVLDRDILRIESKIDCLILRRSIITNKIDLMQRSFHFENYVRNEASKTIELISAMEIVDNLDRFIALGDRKALTNAKKLMKAKHSPVLCMDKNVLLEKLKTLPRYKDRLEIDNGKIKIINQKQAIEFIKMLNDSILRSELTDAEYDSTVKTELPPIQ